MEGVVGFIQVEGVGYSSTIEYVGVGGIIYKEFSEDVVVVYNCICTGRVDTAVVIAVDVIASDSVVVAGGGHSVLQVID